MLEKSLRLLSPPIQVLWAGFRSDTLTLQQNGWSISVREDPFHPLNASFHIAIYNEHLQLGGISKRVDYQFMLMTHEMPLFMQEVRVRDLSIRIEHLGLNFTARKTPWFDEFQPIDATPRYEEIVIRELSDLILFKYIKPDQAEYFLEKATVEQILDIALSKQNPDREERFLRILKEKKLEAYKQSGEHKASIIQV